LWLLTYHLSQGAETSVKWKGTAHQPEQLGITMVLKLLNILLPKHGMSYQTTLDWKILLNNSKTDYAYNENNIHAYIQGT
jgi:hypothetical protein